MNSLSPATLLSRGLIGAVGLSVSAIALLGIPESAKAASFVCGPGAGWVGTCSGGVDSFPSLGKVFVDIDNLDGDFDGTPDFELDLTGPTKIQRSDPFVNGDGLFQIDTEIFSLKLKGSSPIGEITIKAGDGIGNNQNDGSLYSPGAIIEESPNSNVARSFFDIFAEIDLPPLGPLTARNMMPLHLDGVPDLIGVPPGIDDNIVDYVSAFGVSSQFFLFNPETEEFVLDQNGEKILVAQLVPGFDGQPAHTHTPTDKIPEPSSALSISLIGLAAMWKLRKKQLVK